MRFVYSRHPRQKDCLDPDGSLIIVTAPLPWRLVLAPLVSNQHAMTTSGKLRFRQPTLSCDATITDSSYLLHYPRQSSLAGGHAGVLCPLGQPNFGSCSSSTLNESCDYEMGCSNKSSKPMVLLSTTRHARFFAVLNDVQALILMRPTYVCI